MAKRNCPPLFKLVRFELIELGLQKVWTEFPEELEVDRKGDTQTICRFCRVKYFEEYECAVQNI